MQYFVKEIAKGCIEEQKKIKKLKVIKNCNCCKVDKDVLFFYKLKNRGNGLSGYSANCIPCQKDKNNESQRKYKANNSDKSNEYIKKWRQDNKEDIKNKKNIYYENNKEKIIEQVTLYQKERMKTDSLYKLTRGIRSLILISFKNQFTEKSKRTQEILGCTYEEFKLHLESQFDENMNWDNQGTYWHMDHIKPISIAASKSEVYELNHYTNFQPLYWEDNLSKGNKYNINI
jgi:hypothetical protein